MPRRTISISDAIEQLVRDAQEDNESFSAAVSRLIETGVRALGGRRPPAWVGSGEGPRDLGRLAERYLRKSVTAR